MSRTGESGKIGNTWGGTAAEKKQPLMTDLNILPAVPYNPFLYLERTTPHG